MRIEPPSPPSGFSFGGPSLSAAAEAKLFSQLAALAPTASPEAAAAAATGQKMTQQQINTYWLFRVLSDLTMLALTQNGHYPPNAYQPYLNDLNYIQSQNTSLDPTILQYLKTFTTGNNYTQVPAKLGEILDTFINILASPSSVYDFSNFNQDQMFYFYSFQMAYALTAGSEIPDFWSHTGKTSAMATSMGQYITTYFYERNLKNGAEDYAGLKNDLNAFMAQLSPMISTYGDGFQKEFPDIYSMLNGGTDEGGAPYAGLLKDITNIQEPNKWPFFGNNPPPKIPLETPPPPWDNPTSASPPVFVYPTGAYDPGCNFFAFVDGFLTEFFKP